MSSFNVVTGISGYKFVTANLDNDLPDIVGRFSSLLSKVSEVDWYLKEITNASNSRKRISVGYNDISCYVEGDKIFVGTFDENNIESLQSFSTSNFIKFLYELRSFYYAYESGKIPGIIPDSKETEWVIIPREYVKDEYWYQFRPEEE